MLVTYMNVNFNKLLDTLTCQQSYAQSVIYIQYTPINKLAKARAALVNTISSFSPKLPRVLVGLHCNANEKN